MDSQRRALLEDNIIKLMGATDSIYQMIKGQMQKEAGKRFDPVVVEAFLKMMNAE